jgi:lauroyl/myristoyl acyltransferase
MYGTSWRKEDGKVYSMAEDLPKPYDEYADEKEVLQALLDISEKYIRQYPEQYLWLYHRFQHIPPDTPEDIRRRFPYYAKEPNAHFYSKLARKNSAE